jgi:hypothetical protein
MADSNRLLFLSASGGYVTPTFVRWSTQGQITLPGDTWLVTLGWFGSTLVLATLAALFVLHIWNEKTARCAFIAGLVLPYVLSGAVADVASVAKVRHLGAQTMSEYEVAGATKTNLATFNVTVVGTDTTKPLTTARTQIYFFKGDTAVPMATSNFGTYAVPPGKYKLQAAAPGYWSKSVEIDLQNLKAQEQFTISLDRSSWWHQLWTGAKYAVSPQRVPPNVDWTVD